MKLKLSNSTCYADEDLCRLFERVEALTRRAKEQMPSLPGYEEFEPFEERRDADLSHMFFSYYSPTDSTRHKHRLQHKRRLFLFCANPLDNPCYVKIVRSHDLHDNVLEALADVGETRYLPQAAVMDIVQVFFEHIAGVILRGAPNPSPLVAPRWEAVQRALTVSYVRIRKEQPSEVLLDCQIERKFVDLCKAAAHLELVRERQDLIGQEEVAVEASVLKHEEALDKLKQRRKK